jgi:starch synthase
MRVLMVTPGFYPIEGGTETVVRNLSMELKKAGVHVDILTFNMTQKWNPKWNGKTEKLDGITIFKVPALDWFPFNHSPRLNFKVNVLPGKFTHLMKDYDVIHYHEAEFSFPLFSHFVKKPKILHLHGINLEYFKRYHLSRFLLRNAADVYLSLTKQMENELITLGLCKERILYMPNVVDTQVFRPNGEKADNTILFVGRIAPVKGLHVLLKSLKYLKQPITLDIIGPLGWNPDYNQKILKLIEEENRRGKHKINYLGHVHPNQPTLIEKYQKASIFVLPSFYEAFGMVLLEALACETPAISTYTGGTPEIVISGINGILVPVNNHVKLAAAINYLLENKNVRTEFGRNGRKIVENNFSIETAVKKLCRIYERLANN